MTAITDETGKRYGRLEVVALAERLNGKVAWFCRCDCGNTTIVRGVSLRKGDTTSCGCFQREVCGKALIIDEVGHRYGRLTVVALDPVSISGQPRKWLCRCDCGVEVSVLSTSLRTGNTTSCGCVRVRDERGKRYGRLVVIDGPVRARSSLQWKCRCDCGKETFVFASSLRAGRSRSCGCLTTKDETGQKYGRLTVLHRVASRRARCVCDCGAVVDVLLYSLRGGTTRSCGCLRREAVAQASATHGHALRGRTSPEYRAWQGMWDRCTNDNAEGYRWYGAMGVSVCEEWRSFEVFLRDMGPRPRGCSIDRIDCTGNYSPSNCRWATATQQARNKRSTARMPEVAAVVLERAKNGVSPIAIAAEVGISRTTVDRMIKGSHWAVQGR